MLEAVVYVSYNKQHVEIRKSVGHRRSLPHPRLSKRGVIPVGSLSTQGVAVEVFGLSRSAHPAPEVGRRLSENYLTGSISKLTRTTLAAYRLTKIDDKFH